MTYEKGTTMRQASRQRRLRESSLETAAIGPEAMGPKAMGLKALELKAMEPKAIELHRVDPPIDGKRQFPLLALRAAAVMSLFVASTASSNLVLAAGGDLLLQAPYEGLAPQDIAHDPTDNSFFVTGALDLLVRHYNENLILTGSFQSPFAPVDTATGITYYPPNDTLLIVEPLTARLLEITKSGVPVPGGIDVNLDVSPVVNPIGGPLLRGLTYHANGNFGNGSLYAVETVGALVYEFALTGAVIRSFVHPDDPDGFPGDGAGANGGGVALELDVAGDLVGIDLVGGDSGNLVIHRLDPSGVPTGFDIPLDALALGANGSVSGIVRAIYFNPINNEVVNGIYGVNETGGSLFVIDGELPPIAQFTAFDCFNTGIDIVLTWSAGQVYDQIILERNGEPYQLLAGNSTSFVDSTLAPGVYTYSIRGEQGTLATDPESCVRVIGAGHVLDSAEIGVGELCIDITEDLDGLLYITDLNGFLVLVYNKDLNFVGSFPSPFVEMDDELTGIAFRSDTSTLFLYNAFTNMMQETLTDGTPVGAPIAVAIPTPMNDEPFVGGMVYDPTGNGGTGSFFLTELSRSMVYEIALDGSVLTSYLHPDQVFLPTPNPSFLDAHMLGICFVPEVGNGFQQLDIAGGTVLDEKCTRLLRIDADSGALIGFELPTQEIATVNSVRFLAHHHTSYQGLPVSFVVSVRSNDNVLLRVERPEPTVDPVGFLDCRQPTLTNEVVVTFSHPQGADLYQVERDGAFLMTVPGGTTTFTDTPGEGRHRYRVTPIVGAISGQGRDCELRVGIGAELRRGFLSPAFSPYQMTRHPETGVFVISVNTPSLADTLFLFDSDFNFLNLIPAPFEPPFLTAAMAVRPTPSGGEIWSIGWEVPSAFMQPQDFVFARQDMNGAFLQLPAFFDIPGPDPTEAVTYPTGLVHDAASDTFWFLERNLDTFHNMALTGNILSSFPHPSPPLQNFVFNLGASLDADRNAFTVTTAGPNDTQITRAVGMGRDGTLTGEVFSLDEVGMNPIYGLARAEHRIWVMGSKGSIPQIVELKASDDIESPNSITCNEQASGEVLLTWQETQTYDEVVVRRDGVVIATLAGGVGSYVDVGVGAGAQAYSVAGRVGAAESDWLVCGLFVAGGAPTFLRGDVDGNGVVSGLIDALFVLNYQFTGGAEPPCLDAADVDDSGTVSGILDGLALLNFQFSGGLPPAPPYPNVAADPTPDSLGCGGP